MKLQPKPQKNTRREFLEKSLKLGIAIPLLSSPLVACNFNKNEAEKESGTTNDKKLNILILGGTSFLGPHQIAYALSRGHSVSTFTRGKTKPTVHADLFDKVTQLIGDRSNDLKALENGQWDVVIDNSGRNVDWATSSAELLKDKASLYLYTSSTGVYYPYLGKDIKEDTKILMKEPEHIEDEDMKLEYWYGVMKANSEKQVQTIFGEDRTIIARPTYMVGPADKTNRFIHWPIRLAKGGDVLVPGKANDAVQYVDVRDVAEFMIRLIEQKLTGVYNCVGPKQSQNMRDFVAEASSAFNVESNFVNIDDYEFLKTHKVPYLVPWIMPEGNNYGSSLINNDKAVKAGLTFRSLKTTVNETYNWWQSDVMTEKRTQYETNPENLLNREADILKAWEAIAG